jgi:hypothetical protein
VHNERTLAIGMRMAETLREGVQTLTEAQSEWIKAIASARGFFRNVPPPLQLAPPAEPAIKRDDEDEDEDEDEDDADEVDEAPEAPADLPANWMALVPTLAPLVEKLLYVHVAEAHARELPEIVRQAGNGVADPDARILAMLGARAAVRGKNLAKIEAAENENAAISAA